MEGWREEGRMEGWWAQWMEGWVNQTGTEPNRKKNRSEPREPKPNQIPSEKPKRTETKHGFTVLGLKYPTKCIMVSIYGKVTQSPTPKLDTFKP